MWSVHSAQDQPSPPFRLMSPCLRAFALSLLIAAAACSASKARGSANPPSSGAPTSQQTQSPLPSQTAPHALPGMPAVQDPRDIYSADRPNQLSPVVADFPSRIYVPNSISNTVDEIDPATGAITARFGVGALPQHIVPSWDLKTLYVTNDHSNSLTPINPATGRPGPPIPVADPYNLYFTPDGKYAIVVAERLRRLDFRDPHSFTLKHSLRLDCTGVDHMDFSGNGRYLIASCEFSGQLVKIDVAKQAIVGTIALHGGNSKPQDVKVDPTGHIFYVADMARGGVYLVDGDSLKVMRFIPTGAGAHGLYVSRDSKTLYVSNRSAGSVSLIEFKSNTVTATWRLPGGSPDMGGVSADGKILWLSGRSNADVYALDTTTGALVRRVPVGKGPHGLSVYPQPGRYSLGHTGVFR